MAKAKSKTRRWHSSYTKPSRKGWYECKARDKRWDGQTRFRAWCNGSWWIPLVDGWMSTPLGIYQWRGPRIALAEESGRPAEEAEEIAKRLCKAATRSVAKLSSNSVLATM